MLLVSIPEPGHRKRPNSENQDEMLQNVDKISLGWFILHIKGSRAIGTAAAYSVEFRGMRPGMYIEDLL